MNHAARAVLSAACCALAGCGDTDEAARSSSALRDSADVRIVENPEPRWEESQEWRVAEEPALQVGTIDGEEAYQFVRVAGATRLSDGRIVVADGGSARIRFYDADGGHVADAGGSGGGPGEFRDLSGIRRIPGDSVAAWDAAARRLSVFGPDGEFVRSVTQERVEGLVGLLVGIFDDGSFVASPRLRQGLNPRPVPSGAPETYRDTVVYLRFSRTGSFTDTPLTAPGEERTSQRRDGRLRSRPVLFGQDYHAAVGGNRFYGGDSETFEVRVYDPEGALRRIACWAGRARPVSDEHREGELRRRRDRRRGELGQIGRVDRDVPEPDPVEYVHRNTFPAFDRLLPDGRGNLWVRHPVAPGEEARRWSVLGPEGRWLGDVRTPAGLEVLEIGVDYVLGLWKDELGVQYIGVHSLLGP